LSGGVAHPRHVVLSLPQKPDAHCAFERHFASVGRVPLNAQAAPVADEPKSTHESAVTFDAQSR
jgi:hypothetical protein